MAVNNYVFLTKKLENQISLSQIVPLMEITTYDTYIKSNINANDRESRLEEFRQLLIKKACSIPGSPLVCGIDEPQFNKSNCTLVFPIIAVKNNTKTGQCITSYRYCMVLESDGAKHIAEIQARNEKQGLIQNIGKKLVGTGINYVEHFPAPVLARNTLTIK